MAELPHDTMVRITAGALQRLMNEVIEAGGDCASLVCVLECLVAGALGHVLRPGGDEGAVDYFAEGVAARLELVRRGAAQYAEVVGHA